jgi:hypothetical protein
MDTLGHYADYYALHNASDGTRTTLRDLFHALAGYDDSRAQRALRSLQDVSFYGAAYSHQDYDVLSHAASVLRALGGAE